MRSATTECSRTVSARSEYGYYSETLSFDDITYQNARDDDQKTILAAMCDIYNYFPADTTVQFSVINTPLRHDQIRDRQFYDPSRQANDVLKEDAETMNEVLSDKLAEGVSNIKRARYMTIGIHANNPIEARTRFSRINTDLTGNFEQIRCDVTPMTGCSDFPYSNRSCVPTASSLSTMSATCRSTAPTARRTSSRR